MKRRSLLASLLTSPAVARAMVSKLAVAAPKSASSEPMPGLVDEPSNDETELAIYSEDGILHQLYINGKPVTIAEYELWRSGVNIDDRTAGRSVYWQPERES